jgi:hypothetical protein
MSKLGNLSRRRSSRLFGVLTATLMAFVLVGAQASLALADEPTATTAPQETPPPEEQTPPPENTPAEEPAEQPAEEAPPEEPPTQDAQPIEASDLSQSGNAQAFAADSGNESESRVVTLGSRTLARVSDNDDGNVCPPLDGKWEVGSGWEGSSAPGITVTSSGEGSITFTVASGYTLTAICMKTGNGVNAGDWSVNASFPVVGPATVTVTSSGGQGAGLSHITFSTETSTTPEDTYKLKVKKLWDPLEGGTSDTPPGDLPEGFQLTLTGQDNNGSMTCSYDGGSLDCTGNLEVEDGDTVSVTENVDGWTGPSEATADCESEENETGGTDTECTISVTNVQDQEPENSYKLKVKKLWDPLEGETTKSPPGDLPEGFQLTLTGQSNNGSLTCSYVAASLSCDGNLVVQDGDTVTVTENLEGWTGPSEATADCESTENETGGYDTYCTIEVTNVQDQKPENTYKLSVIKQWVVNGQPTTQPPAELPAGFQLVLGGQGQNTGSLTCSYVAGSLDCSGNLVVSDGETVSVTENADGWTGPSEATADCESSENETSGIDTECTISVMNVAVPVVPTPTPTPTVGAEVETKTERASEQNDPAAQRVEGTSGDDELAFTGTDVIMMIVLAVGLALAGATLMYLDRREQKRSQN